MSGRDPKTKEEKQIVKPKGKYVVAEIPTQTDFIIMNGNDNKETYSLLTAVCKIMNDVEIIKEKIK